ncbi:glycosyltransferase [Cloacibacillus porcorum]|uniref:glycosyltransferase n=1 Tax=Cloacibacillus porcorum TaxID=1197717 RepID=UPI0023F1FD99|nr:glycosyltransferase [Cloacibacillus porcorum]MDD7648000.1 glycosyltransferase [Cloacibacillus porcorum]MDY4093472.1 glycosyltransferase [Cloacibacillus porcorum]
MAQLNNIVFLISHVPNPRINKRIAVAQKCGNVFVVCTRRKSQNIWEPVNTNVKHIILDVDLPSSRHILKRYFISKNYQKAALKNLFAINPDLMYVEGLDSLMIANKYRALNKAVHIFFEVADLREYFIEKPKSLLARFMTKLIAYIEKKNFKSVGYLIVTSMKFYDFHYKDLISKDKVLYMPNIPEAAPFAKYKRKTRGKFTVGFIGSIRYLKQMKMLVDAAERAGCNVLFAGAGVTTSDYLHIIEYCKDKYFVTFTGKYNYNEDIANLYGAVDCIYAVYDADNPNVRIALPNKLYEAVYCKLPIIVAKGTYLSEIVEKWCVGVAVSCTDPAELEAALRRLSADKDYYMSFCEAHQLHGYEININSYNKKLYEQFLKTL